MAEKKTLSPLEEQRRSMALGFLPDNSKATRETIDRAAEQLAADRAPPGLSYGAYLIAEFDVTGDVPVFSRLLFASAAPECLTHSMRYRMFTVATEPAVDGIWYGESQKKLRERIMTDPFYKWCRTLLPTETEE